MATRFLRADDQATEVPEGQAVEQVAYVYEDGSVHPSPEGSGSYTLPAATSGAIGGVKLAAAVTDATDDAVGTLNALLASLRAAGVLAQ